MAAPDWPRQSWANVRIWSLEGRGLIWRKQQRGPKHGGTLFGPRRPKRQLSGTHHRSAKANAKPRVTFLGERVDRQERRNSGGPRQSLPIALTGER
jgi:hypothetical protein